MNWQEATDLLDAAELAATESLAAARQSRELAEDSLDYARVAQALAKASAALLRCASGRKVLGGGNEGETLGFRSEEEALAWCRTMVLELERVVAEKHALPAKGEGA